MRAIVVLMAGLLTASGPGKGERPLSFRDVTEESGLLPQVGGIRGHAAGWGDADGNGWIDLYVGTFHNEGSKANMLFRNDGGTFRLDEQKAVGISTRANSGLFADFDNDGDLDLYVASMPGVVKGDVMAPCTLFRNDGGGTYVNVAEGNGACPPEGFAGRSAAALDFDGDGLLDLLVGDCVFKMYKGQRTSRLFRNKGGLRFEDVSKEAGLPPGIPGLGVAAGDANNDGWPDFFIAAREGGNRLFLNDGKGKFREAACSPKLFEWNPPAKSDDTPAGAVFGDVNRDGLLDLVVGHHYSTPWKSPVPVRLYLNRGIESGEPRFEDVTEAAGLEPLFIKAPHVEIQDFDNDGWPDISTSIVKFAGRTPHPVIFRGQGVRDGLPRFRDSSAGVNDFPTAEDRAIGSSGPFFKKVIADRKVTYTAPGPTGDFDNDGRLDIFMCSWWLEWPSVLLRNETAGGRWLDVRFQAASVKNEAGTNFTVNRMGIGARIRVYKAGRMGQAEALIGCREMAVGYGYASNQPAIAHFGLGAEEAVDLEIVLPHGRGRVERPGVKADQRLTIEP